MHKPRTNKPHTLTKPNNNGLTNSLRLKSPQGIIGKQNVTTILERLPFLRQLNALQNQLTSIKPTWNAWLNSDDKQIIKQFSTLSNVSDNTVYIHCIQSSAATLLKHQKGSLLEQFHKSGFENIKNIHIQMQLEHKQDILNPELTKDNSLNNTAMNKNWPKPSASAIKSIEATQSIIKDEQLAESLQRLANTLKKAT